MTIMFFYCPRSWQKGTIVEMHLENPDCMTILTWFDDIQSMMAKVGANQSMVPRNLTA